jgi:hypothetical protein
MPAKKKYYKTIVTVTVLSEEPVDTALGLGDIHEEIINGPWSGVVDVGEGVELTGKEMAAALLAQGSDSEFFGLTPEGEEIDYDARREEAENE